MKPTIIFDLGGVLIDWNPRHFFKTVFDEEEQMNFFLENICTNDWNEMQDAGRSLEEATEILVGHFPEYEAHIRMYYSEWTSMLNGSISGTLEILESLKRQDYRLLALTNWSNETFPIARGLFEFLGWFEDILISGKERLKKPDAAIFNLLIKRYKLQAATSIFIDDNLKNITSAAAVGLDAIHFTNPPDLRFHLRARGIEV